jgi:hypothetical protein
LALPQPRWGWSEPPDAAHDVTEPAIPQLRQIKDDGEIDADRKASEASILGSAR